MNRFCGIWVTMVTPFHNDGTIDYGAVDALTEHFVESGIDGLFAVCQSSEMFHLSERELFGLCQRIVRTANGRIRVIASGFTSYDPVDQLSDILRARDAGAEASVLITNLIATKQQSDDEWKERIERLTVLIPDDIILGLYECPAPYKRLLSPELIRYLAETGRYYFLKETSCDLNQIGPKIKAAKGSQLSILNANAQLLVPSIEMGAHGFSGIMANMQAKLYAYLWGHFSESGRGGFYDRLAEYLCASASFEAANYPTCAKYVLNRLGVRMNTYSRNPGAKPLSESTSYMLDRFVDVNRGWEADCMSRWGAITRG